MRKEDKLTYKVRRSSEIDWFSAAVIGTFRSSLFGELFSNIHVVRVKSYVNRLFDRACKKTTKANYA